MNKVGDIDKNMDKNSSISNEVNLKYKDIENINAKDGTVPNTSPAWSRSNGLMSNSDIKTKDISYKFKSQSSINHFDDILAKGQSYISDCMSTINQIIRGEEQSEISNRNDDSADIGKNKVSDVVTDSARPLRIITRDEWGAEPPTNGLDPLELPAIRVIIAHTVYPFPRTERECKMQCVRLRKIDKNYRLYGHRQLKVTQSPGKALYSIITTWEHWSEEILPP